MRMNFDHRLFEVFRDAKCLLKMGLEVPETAKTLLKNEKSLIMNYNCLKASYIYDLTETCNCYDDINSYSTVLTHIRSHGFVRKIWIASTLMWIAVTT